MVLRLNELLLFVKPELFPLISADQLWLIQIYAVEPYSFNSTKSPLLLTPGNE